MEDNPRQVPLLRVGLTYNLKKNDSADSDEEAEYDSIDTVLAIKNALEKNGCIVELMEATEELPGKLAGHPVDIVFNIAEGTRGRGREAQIPAVLNLFKIPFTGSDETTLCLALDKALTKRLLTTYHIRTPKYRLITREERHLRGGFTFPAIVKPNAEGSSKGISDVAIAENITELRKLVSDNIRLYDEDMLVEEYIDGREFTVGIVGNGEHMRVFAPMEIIYVNRVGPFKIYSYNVKQHYKELISYKCPADVSGEVETEMIQTSQKIYQILGCRDFARIDYRLSPEGRLYFIEINPLPGLMPGYSDFPMIAEFNGMDYTSLVMSVFEGALKRYGFFKCNREVYGQF